MDPSGERGRHDTRFADITINEPSELPYSINLFVFNEQQYSPSWRPIPSFPMRRIDCMPPWQCGS